MLSFPCFGRSTLGVSFSTLGVFSCYRRIFDDVVNSGGSNFVIYYVVEEDEVVVTKVVSGGGVSVMI